MEHGMEEDRLPGGTKNCNIAEPCAWKYLPGAAGGLAV